MYSLDVNFLNDRTDYKSDKGVRRSPRLRPPIGGLNSLYLGVGAGLLLPALVGAGWLLVQNQNTQLENKVAALDAQLNGLGTQEQQLAKIQADTNKIKGESQGLATVFNQIRPWSATLEDLRDRIPTAVQIETIKQIASSAVPQQVVSTSNSASPAPAQVASASNPAGGIEISGMASTFNDVNDFLLTMQQSPLFKSTDSKIVTAELIDSPVSAGSGRATTVASKPPQVVKYTIQSNLSDTPASNLIPEFERKGTLGLVTRIRTLQKTGVIQP